MSEFWLKIIFISVEVFLVICSCFVGIFRKRYVIKDTIFELLLEELPKFIILAEKLKLGSQKKEFVLGVAYSFLSKYSGKDISVVAEEYGDRVCSAIESILSTPQKKGV